MSKDETKPKCQAKATKVLDEDKGTVTINFINDESVVFPLSKVSDNILKRLALHGANQKLGDSYASIKTVEGSLEACQTVAERLIAGEWVQGPRSRRCLPDLGCPSGRQGVGS